MFVRNVFISLWLVLLPATALAADLPVRNVVLFRNGVGMVLRQASVTGNQDLVFAVQEDRLADLLKTMNFYDLDGGRLEGVVWDHSEPLTVLKENYNFDLKADDNLHQILKRFQGVAVAVQTADDRHTGRVLGIQPPAPGQRDKAEGHLSLVTETADLVNIPLEAIIAVKFQDRRLESEFGRYLETLSAEFFKKKREVIIRARGDGERRVLLAYLTTFPVWKTSYRLVVDADGLQCRGWASIYNTTGEDWRDIRLEFVSDRPFSYQYDLSRPRMVDRPELPEDLPDLQSEIDELYETEDLARQMAEQLNALRRPAENQGEAFAYRIDSPVDVPADEAVLLPFFDGRLNGEKICFVSYGDEPLNALWITNSSGQLLDSGICSVYEEDYFRGESFLPRLPAGASDFVYYGRDAELLVNGWDEDSPGRLRRVSIQKETMTGHREMKRDYRFQVQNLSAATRRLVLQLPRQQSEATLETDLAQLRQDDTRWYLDTTVESGQKRELSATEIVLQAQESPVTALTDGQLEELRQGRLVDESTLDQLVKLRQWARAIDALNKKLEEARGEIRRIAEGHDRLRENIRVLLDSPEEEALRRKYIGQLSQDEDELERLRTDVKRMEKELEDLRHNRDDLAPRIQYPPDGGRS